MSGSSCFSPEASSSRKSSSKVLPCFFNARKQASPRSSPRLLTVSKASELKRSICPEIKSYVFYDHSIKSQHEQFRDKYSTMPYSRRGSKKVLFLVFSTAAEVQLAELGFIFILYKKNSRYCQHENK